MKNKQMINNKNKDLGTGSIPRLLFSLAVPTVTAQIVNMLYNVVDRMYIGHIADTGVESLTGLGLCFPVIMMISAFSSLIGMGGAPQAAIAMGRNDNKRAEKILGNSFIMITIISIIITIILLIYSVPLLKLFGASSNILPYSLAYLKIYTLGTFFVQFTLAMNAFITTQGFTRESMFTVLIGAILNIILDPIFIFGLNMGVKGAALATIVSQAVSALWVFRFLISEKSLLKLSKKNFRLSGNICLAIISLGVSPFVMQATESLLNICFNASLSRYGGYMAVGAMTILSSVNQISMLVMLGITQAAQPIISYNYGAYKNDRVKEIIKILVKCLVGIAVVFFILVQVFPAVFVKIFNNSSEELMDITVWAMHIYFAGFIMIGFQNSLQQSFVALSQAKISLFLACERKLILLIPLIYILPLFMENKLFAVFLAEPIADILAASTTIIVFCLNIPKILRENKINGK